MEFLPQQNKVNAGDKIKGQTAATGKNVIVIGGGDTGSDCVGTSNRHGAVSVTQFELMPMPPSRRTSRWCGRTGPSSCAPRRATKRAARASSPSPPRSSLAARARTRASSPALKTVHIEFKDGKLVEVAGSEKVWPADLVLLAMGFTNPVAQLLQSFGVDEGRARQCQGGVDEKTATRRTWRQGLGRRRRAPRPVAGGVGDSRGPPGGARDRPGADGRDHAAALGRWAATFPGKAVATSRTPRQRATILGRTCPAPSSHAAFEGASMAWT
jgi:NADPH-dependent glutamate synthase beta subunit-like oxidoreductase